MAEVTQRGGQQPSWSDIPRDLAGHVLRLLPAYADRACFAAVCPQWRAAARQHALPPSLPLLALPDGTFYSLPYGKKFRCPGFGCADYKIAACGSWLVFPCDDGCFLVDPFAGATVKLPALSRVRLRPPNAVAKYVMVEGGKGRRCDPYVTWMHMKDMEEVPMIRKLILCSPNLAAAFIGIGRAIQIVVCQPGASSWSVRANDPCNFFEDMAFYQEKLYTLSHYEDLLVMNIGQDPRSGDPQVSRIGQVIRGDRVVLSDGSIFEKKLYLVESRGALLMVRRKVCFREISDEMLGGQSEFEVFKADFKNSRWVNVTTLGDDQMLFLGRWCSRAVSASHYGMSSDLIFFIHDVMENVTEYTCEDTTVSVYNMRTSQVSCPLPMVWKRKMIFPTWLFPWGLK
ncbi:unnamed protein product [Urochloa decumbens]|uniref:DUF295 domain-containing protein n=1 Tax=Urochloa decumbens TaxID=240449 RepID=A0ABC9FC42_9POAL